MEPNAKREKNKNSSIRDKIHGVLEKILGKGKRCIAGTVLCATSIIGAGLKLGPVAVIDEIGLFIYGLFNVTKQKFSIKFDIFTITLIWFLIHGIIGLYYENINVLRYIAIPAILLLYNGVIGDLKIQHIRIASIVFILCNVAIPITGICLGLSFAWWQDWLWTGTAYASIAIVFSAIVLMAMARRNYIVILVLGTVTLISVLTDSRFLMLLNIFLALAFILKKMDKKIKILYVMLAASVALTIYGISDPASSKSFRKTLNDVYIMTEDIILGSASLKGNSDRMDHIRSVYTLYQKEPFYFFVGHGSLSHQYGLTEYLPASSDGRVRPTGLPAIVYDGGIVFLGLIIISTGYAVQKLVVKARRIKAPLYVLYLCLLIPFVVLLSIPITNSLEMVLWWLAIAPKGLGYIILREHQRSAPA